MPYTHDDVAELIDHTLLKSEATHSQVRELVEGADEPGVCPVCASPSLLPLPLDLGNVKLVVVCGSPSGAHHSDTKAVEAARAVAQGTDEVDVVVDPIQAVGNESEKVETDIRAVREAMPRAALKVIIESAALSDEQIVIVYRMAKAADAGFVKTSMGFHPSRGASVYAVALMKTTVGETTQVKTSGGTRDGKFAVELFDAEAARLGFSANTKVPDTL